MNDAQAIRDELERLLDQSDRLKAEAEILTQKVKSLQASLDELDPKSRRHEATG